MKISGENTFELEIVDKPATKMNASTQLNLDPKINVDNQVLLKLKEKKAQNYSSLLEKVNIINFFSLSYRIIKSALFIYDFNLRFEIKKKLKHSSP